jgi:hypothetical protein
VISLNSLSIADKMRSNYGAQNPQAVAKYRYG